MKQAFRLRPQYVEDCRCALRWALKNAKQYNIDVNRIVLTGHSGAGGYLSLITGMLPEGTGLDNNCDSTEKPKLPPIINWYGVTDVADVVQGPNRKENYAVMWMGSQPLIPPHDCKASLAIDLRSSRTAAHPGHSRRTWTPSCPTISRRGCIRLFHRGGCAERTGDDQGRRPRAVYGRRIRRCLPQDQRAFLQSHGLAAVLA